jgi:hypothetical protein
VFRDARDLIETARAGLSRPDFTMREKQRLLVSEE